MVNPRTARRQIASDRKSEPVPDIIDAIRGLLAEAEFNRRNA